MAKWFVILEGSEQGPLEGSQLRQLADSGKLSPEDLVRRNDMERAVQARRVNGLFAAVSVTPSKAQTAGVASDARPPVQGPSHMGNVAQSDKSKSPSADEQEEETQEQKLAEADLRTGSRAFDLSVEHPAARRIFNKVHRLDKRMAQFESRLASKPTGFVAKMDRLALEADLKARARLLTEAGRKLRLASDIPEQLTKEVELARQMAKEARKAGAAIPSAALTANRESFSSWYRANPGKWPVPAQIAAWIVYGFIWIPSWWAVSQIQGDAETRQIRQQLAVGLIMIMVVGAGFVLHALFGPGGVPPATGGRMIQKAVYIYGGASSYEGVKHQIVEAIFSGANEWNWGREPAAGVEVQIVLSKDGMTDKYGNDLKEDRLLGTIRQGDLDEIRKYRGGYYWLSAHGGLQESVIAGKLIQMGATRYFRK